MKCIVVLLIKPHTQMGTDLKNNIEALWILHFSAPLFLGASVRGGGG